MDDESIDNEKTDIYHLLTSNSDIYEVIANEDGITSAAVHAAPAGTMNLVHYIIGIGGFLLEPFFLNASQRCAQQAKFF
jgi:hypothetical protein